MVISAIESVLMVFIIVAFGYFIGHKGWANESVTNFITKLIINITLPCTAVASFLSNFSAETLGSAWILLLAAAGSTLLSYAVCKLVIVLAKIEKSKRGVFTSLFCYSNSIFIGLPVATAIFGDAGSSYALLFYIINALFVNSLGYMEISRDGALLAGHAQKKEKGGLVKRIFQPPLVAIIIAFVLVLLGVKLPDFLMDTLSYTGGITAPLAIIYVGIILQRAGLRSLRKIDKDMALVLLGKFIVAPACMFFVGMLAGLEKFPMQVFIMQMSLPSVTQTAIAAGHFGAHTKFAANGVALTTLFSFITIPVYAALLYTL
ncbi:MAG: AEC family transporter [Christensenellaceae bacterium]|jgi:predicted permease